MKNKKVSRVVIKRLPRYYRYLAELLSKEIYRISSNELGAKMGVTASQIRQDLNCFGGFGQQGYGYNVQYLYNEIGAILGVNKGYKAIIVGAGNLGNALAKHANFEKRGFTLIGIFDSNESKVGQIINGIEVYHSDTMEQFIKQHKPDIAILTIPKNVVNKAVGDLAKWGIKGFWNFSYGELSVEEDVAIENVHLTDSLMILSYKISESSQDGVDL